MNFSHFNDFLLRLGFLMGAIGNEEILKALESRGVIAEEIAALDKATRAVVAALYRE